MTTLLSRYTYPVLAVQISRMDVFLPSCIPASHACEPLYLLPHIGIQSHTQYIITLILQQYALTAVLYFGVRFFLVPVVPFFFGLVTLIGSGVLVRDTSSSPVSYT